MNRHRSDYEIGYGKPPQYTRFRKGQSGNPNGRPKGAVSFARLVRQALNEKITIRENGERRIITKLQAALKQLANKAASGDPAAIRELIRLQPIVAGLEAVEKDALQCQPTEAISPERTDPRKIALALLHVLEAAKAAGASEEVAR